MNHTAEHNTRMEQPYTKYTARAAAEKINSWKPFWNAWFAEVIVRDGIWMVSVEQVELRNENDLDAWAAGAN